MRQNIHNDPRFFEGYLKMREAGTSLIDVVEQPAIKASLPPLRGLSVLVLGFGMGHVAHYCAVEGATRVLATDISAKMLNVAQRERSHERLEYVLCAMEELEVPAESFDLVVSSFALHYVADYAIVVRKVERCLKTGGRFIFSIEHPIITACNPVGKWVESDDGKRLHWPVDNYSDEGRREASWFMEGVVKYHRKLSTLLNELITNGLAPEKVEEPEAPPAAVHDMPYFSDERRRPSVLIVRAIKGD